MYLKIFRADDKHHGFQYQNGLNVDSNKFEPEGSCVAGGFYFTTIEHINKFFCYGDYIRIVEVPEGAEMVKDSSGDKWRASSLFLHPKQSLNDVDTWKMLIDNGIDSVISICAASYYGELKQVEILINLGIDCTVHGNWPIQLASEHGHLEIVKLLLKHGADCTAKGSVALFHAMFPAHQGIDNSELIELLLKHGAEPQMIRYHQMIGKVY